MSEMSSSVLCKYITTYKQVIKSSTKQFDVNSVVTNICNNLNRICHAEVRE